MNPLILRLAVVAGFCGLLLGCSPRSSERPPYNTPPTITVIVHDRLNKKNAQTVLQPNGLAQFNPPFDIFIMVIAHDSRAMKELQGAVNFVSNTCGSLPNAGDVYWDPIDSFDQVATVSPQNIVPQIPQQLVYLREVKRADVQELPCGWSHVPLCCPNSSGIGSIVVWAEAYNHLNKSVWGQYVIRIGNGVLPLH